MSNQKNDKKTCLYFYRLYYPLVKFDPNSFTIQGGKECDRRMDRQTQGGSNN